MKSLVASGVLVGTALLLGGCGQPVGLVTGEVTQDGQPVPAAEVRFESQEDTRRYYRGISSEDGSIHLDYREKPGLPAGPYKVIIKHYTLASGELLPEGESGDALKEEGQAVQHTTVFEREITGGRNKVIFELSEGQRE